MFLVAPENNPLLSALVAADSSARRMRPAQLVDAIAGMERRAARRARLFDGYESPRRVVPARWFRSEPRASIQYAGHMSTEAARDKRLTPRAVCLLQVLRARVGHGTRTETTKTTLAHILGVTVRTVGNLLADLERFDYITRRARVGRSGLVVGLVLTVREKVFPCFRDGRWLEAWLAVCEGSGIYPQTRRNSARKIIADKNQINENPLILAPPG